jgi:hypothetical protein
VDFRIPSGEELGPEEYSGHKITSSFSYVTERGVGKIERAKGHTTAKSLSEHVQCD